MNLSSKNIAFGLPAFLASVLNVSNALAAPVTIDTPFMNLENRGVNSLGFGTGQFFRFGANSVTPNGAGGTTGVGSTTNLLTNQVVTQSIAFTPGPVIPNFFGRYLTDNSSLYGPWNLKFSNGADSAQTVVSLPAGTTQAPFVNSITLSGTSSNPTFSWTPPAGTSVNGYRINIFDKSLVSATSNGQVVGRNFAPSVTSYTFNAADFTVPGYGFQLNRNYSIEIGLIQTKDKTSSDLSNANLAAISRVYADFRPNTGGGPSVNLPVTLVNGAYQFNISVTAGKTYFIDPPVAVGYDYRVAAGNPSFKSVVLPGGVGDDRFDIFGFNSLNQAVLLAHDWLAGAVFDFGAGGVNAFRIGGIEESAGLDPANTTAFVTGVSFVADGLFTGTQTPIVLDVSAVPEPGTYALMLLGLGALVIRSRWPPKA